MKGDSTERIVVKLRTILSSKMEKLVEFKFSM